MKDSPVLFFDLDDTLVDSDSAYEVGMQSIGLSSTDSLYLKARADVKAELPELAPCARSRALYFKKYLEYKNEYSPLKHIEMIQAYEKTVLETISAQWKNLKRDVLMTELKSLCPKIFIVTNETVRVQMAKLNVMDPTFKFFNGYITSEEAGFEKPNPIIYERAFLRMNTEPSKCIMVGDSYVNDIEAALKLGLKAVHTLEFKKSKQVGPISIQKLDELPRLILEFYK